VAVQKAISWMFALKAGRHHALQRRAYATVDGVRIASTVTPPWSRRFQLQDEDEEDIIGPTRRTVCIRMSRPPAGGMVDAFAVIRGVERKFGRIREYRFIRVCCGGALSKLGLLTFIRMEK